jgi:MYXO-CTERM domain-containing protein
VTLSAFLQAPTGGLRTCAFAAAFVAVTGSVSSVRAAEAPANCSHTSTASDGHTCGHGRFGPFESRVGVPYPSASPLTIPNVDPTHTLYTVLLSGESATEHWVVSYKANVAGTYAFYLDRPGTDVIEEQPFPFELRDAFGEVVPVRLEHVITACPGYFAWVKVYEIDAARYHLVVGGSPGDNVQVAVEHVDGMGAMLFTDADGDGYGVGIGLSSWCGAAAGYSLLDGDCNDDDAHIFPDGEGVCEFPEGRCAGAVGDCPDGLGGAGPNPSQSGGALNDDTAGGGGPPSNDSPGRDSGESSGGANGAGAWGSDGEDGGEREGGLAGGPGEPGRPDDDGSEGGGSRDDVEGGGCSCHVGAKPTTGGALWGIASVGYLWAHRRGRRVWA